LRLYACEGVPGTGKTTLCKELFLKAVDNNYTVCYETFRRNMADDFKLRLVGVDKKDTAWVSTTHGICFRLLARSQGYTRDDIATAKEWKEFCRKLGIPVDVSEMDRVVRDRGESVTHISDLDSPGVKIYVLYSNCVNTLTSFDEWYKLPPSMNPPLPPPLSSEFPTIIDKWLSFLDAKNMIDFPQMLQKTLELKLSPPTDVYIADEFQDKTPIQYELFKLWSRDKEIVMVAGDVCQTIYSFWGTSPKFFNEVRRRAKFKVLTPSWRLSSDVYKRACTLLKRSNQEVFDVECRGETVFREISFSTFIDAITKEYKDIMILARTNYHLAAVANVLMNTGVPFLGRYGWSSRQLGIYSFVWKYRHGVEPIYKHEFLEYLKSTKAYSQVTLNFMEKSMKNELSLSDVNNYLPATHKVVLNSDSPFKLIDLSEKAMEKLTRAIHRNVPPRTDILLTTIHGAKGLEANTVVVFDGITSKIQKSMVIDQEEFKNEYRVWYVALTRAKKYCFVVRDAPVRFNIPFLPYLT